MLSTEQQISTKLKNENWQKVENTTNSRTIFSKIRKKQCRKHKNTLRGYYSTKLGPTMKQKIVLWMGLEKPGSIIFSILWQCAVKNRTNIRQISETCLRNKTLQKNISKSQLSRILECDLFDLIFSKNCAKQKWEK